MTDAQQVQFATAILADKPERVVGVTLSPDAVFVEFDHQLTAVEIEALRQRLKLLGVRA